MEYRIPLIGEKFPEIEVKTTHGLMKLPEHFKGKWFVLFSHPADFTPVCTTEFIKFQEEKENFDRLGCELIGLSVDQVFSHIKWVEWIKDRMEVDITFPIIADDMGEVAKRLGMIHPNKGTNTVRAVFIVDDKGIIRLILYYPQEVGRNIKEVLRAVEALQISDKHGVAIPANWPENEMTGRKVILPPPDSVQLAEERVEKAKSGKLECFDWWFCLKSVE